MKKMDIFGYQVEIDEEGTREWYNKANQWGCECEGCKHFIDLAIKRELPTEVLETLEEFGIAPEKATYVCKILTEEEQSLYQFSYRIAGNILSDEVDDVNCLGKCCHEIYPHGAPGFPTPHFDLEFWVRLPRIERGAK